MSLSKKAQENPHELTLNGSLPLQPRLPEAAQHLVTSTLSASDRAGAHQQPLVKSRGKRKSPGRERGAPRASSQHGLIRATKVPLQYFLQSVQRPLPCTGWVSVLAETGGGLRRAFWLQPVSHFTGNPEPLISGAG